MDKCKRRTGSDESDQDSDRESHCSVAESANKEENVLVDENQAAPAVEATPLKERQGKFWLHDDRYGQEAQDTSNQSDNISRNSLKSGRGRRRGLGKKISLDDKWTHDKFREDEEPKPVDKNASVSAAAKKKVDRVITVNKNVIKISKKNIDQQTSEAAMPLVTTQAEAESFLKSVLRVGSAHVYDSHGTTISGATTSTSINQVTPSTSADTTTTATTRVISTGKEILNSDFHSSANANNTHGNPKRSTEPRDAPLTDKDVKEQSRKPRIHVEKKKSVEISLQDRPKPVPAEHQDFGRQEPMEKLKLQDSTNNPPTSKRYSAKKKVDLKPNSLKQAVDAPVFEPSHLDMEQLAYSTASINIQPMMTSTGQVVYMTDNGLMVPAENNYIYGYGSYPAYMQTEAMNGSPATSPTDTEMHHNPYFFSNGMYYAHPQMHPSMVAPVPLPMQSFEPPKTKVKIKSPVAKNK